MLRRTGRRFGGGGFKRKRFPSRGGKRFNGKMRMTKPVLYKFAAPTARQKLTWVGTYSHFSGCGTETQAANWKEPSNWSSGDVTNRGRDGLFWSIVGNDCKDPADHGHYNQILNGAAPWNGAATFGQLLDHTHRPFGWDEWMKLYRKCYVTGCKMSVEFHGGVAADNAGSLEYQGAGVGLTLVASEKAPPANSAAGYQTDIVRGGVFGALGNQNMKMKMMRPKRNMMNSTVTEKMYYFNSDLKQEVEKKDATMIPVTRSIVNPINRIDGFNSIYKATKHILGLKTVYGDDNLSCNTDTNTVKRWSLSGFVSPTTSANNAGGAGFVKGIAIIKVTFWCTFSSRRQVAQAQDIAGY